MSAELNLNAYFTFYKDGVYFCSLRDANQPLSNAIAVNVNGKKGIRNTVEIGLGDETLDPGDLGTIGFCYFHNLGTPFISTPPAPIVTHFGTAGSATWSYVIVAWRTADVYTVHGATGTTTTGNATLTSDNYNFLQWLPVNGAIKYDIYRTVSGGTPSTLGLIATVLSSATYVESADGLTYVWATDTGGAGDTTTAPTTTPWDQFLEYGPTNTSYPNALKGGEFAVGRWNAAAIHAKATVNPTLLDYILIED